jgi:probable phosphoglycerate mutase
VRADARLNEMHMGPWEGLTEIEVAQRFPNEHALWSTLPDRLVLPGRETLRVLAGRVVAAVDDATQRPHPALLMTHVAPIRVAALAALGMPLSSYKRVHVGNGDALIIDRHMAHVRRLEETRSLRDELPPAMGESSLA